MVIFVPFLDGGGVDASAMGGGSARLNDGVDGGDVVDDERCGRRWVVGGEEEGEDRVGIEVVGIAEVGLVMSRRAIPGTMASSIDIRRRCW